MTDGRYLYCILAGIQRRNFGNIGLFGKQAYSVPYKEISAVVSNVPFKEMRPDAEIITSHQRVVEEARGRGTILPARFGIIFKSDDGVKKMLIKSYKELESKITKMEGKDEFGLKIIIDGADLRKLNLATEDNPEIKKIKREISSSGKGTAYFLKMKMDEAIKNQTYRKIDELSGKIHRELAKTSDETCLLKADFDQIMLNAAYLVNRNDTGKFHSKLDELKEKYQRDGLIFYSSGPWAPYSFC
ncbi:MAG: GvpL/GvpF family gas vesicle protein [Nitrosotalea sp.]